MCWVMPPASPDWTLARRILSRRLVFPWSTWPITVTTGGFSTRSSGSSSGATSTGSGSSTVPISTCTPSSSATSSISSVERVWVSVFISPRPIRTLMIWVGGTPKASPRSLTVAPGSTRTPPCSPALPLRQAPARAPSARTARWRDGPRGSSRSRRSRRGGASSADGPAAAPRPVPRPAPPRWWRRAPTARLRAGFLASASCGLVRPFGASPSPNTLS